MSSDDGEKGTTVENLGFPNCPEIEPEIGPEIEPETESAAEEREKLNPGDDRQEEREESDKATACTTESEKQIDVPEDDDDGFKTPTSADHRIPPVTECPWAPRKPRPSPSKRKASPARVFRRLQFDSSPEVESIFRQIEDISEEPKVKRARRDDDEESS